MNILIIAGHGNGDSGAVGCGYQEATLTRQAANILEGKLKAYALNVSRYPSARNAYEDNRNGALRVDFSNYSLIIELHFNSFNSSAHGCEVLYKPNALKALASKVSAAIASVGFTNRGAKRRTDLANMNKAARMGVPYILIETCFIDNKGDMKLYEANLYSVWDKVAAAVCSYYGVKKLASGGQPVDTNKTPANDKKPVTGENKGLLAVDGYWGQATTRAAQKYFGTTIDGIVSNQPLSNRQFLPRCSMVSWDFRTSGYKAGSSVVREIQRKTGATIDGFFGRESVQALQKMLGVSVDGYCGEQTVKAWQKYLNSRIK